MSELYNSQGTGAQIDEAIGDVRSNKAYWNSKLDSYTETDPTVPAWAKAKTKPTYNASEVGLGNVGNFKAVSTVASQGLTNTEQSNARAHIGAGTSSLTIGTTASTAAAGNHTHTAANVGAVPTSRTVNGKALSANITLSASDVGADASGAAASVQSNLNGHKGDTTVHITAAERTKWNGKSGKAVSFAVTLTVAGWSGNTQNVSNSKFVTSGYAYTVCPAGDSFAGYAEAVIYADDVTTAGKMTFHCSEKPTANLTVNILRTEATT